MKLRVSSVVFSIVYCVAYLLVLALEWPLFRYYPTVKSFTWGWQSLQNSGPAMAWYGLMATAALFAIVAAVVIPSRYVAELLKGWLWIFPVITMLGCVYLMGPFFFR
jgi:hypothetical protein